MHHSIGRQTRRELLETLRQRYQQAPKAEKTKILDEFVALAGCHRKHAIRSRSPHPVLDEVVRAQVEQVAADEIFFGRRLVEQGRIKSHLRVMRLYGKVILGPSFLFVL